LNSSCSTVVPSQEPLADWQKTGLNLLSSWQGRDIVLAIDLTGSVKLDNEGRLRIEQIIRDRFRSGDSVYVVPFASVVNPVQPQVDCLSTEAAIQFHGQKTDIDRILQRLPRESSNAFQNTDIQLAEATIYRGLAQLNQCRLAANQPIRFQSVVWVTDAPLLTKPGIKTDTWKETPAQSPFRYADTAQSKERQEWLDTLPLKRQSQKINNNYDLTVVDIAPTVQEFCTPAPGGQKTCLVNGYLFQQLWLPTSIVLLVLCTALAGSIWAYKHWRSLQQDWKLTISGEDDAEPQIRYLSNHGKLSIDSDIDCRGQDVRGYLRREGNQLFLEPGGELSICYQNREVTQRQLLKGKCIRLNYRHDSREYELTIKIN
jgi:hypothetical protein